MRVRPLLAALAPVVVLAGCATTVQLPPTQVIRYHLGEPLGRGAVAVQPDPAMAAMQPEGGSLEFQAYADAVSRQLARVGYPVAAPGAPAEYIATVSYSRHGASGPPRHPPVSIGLGIGGFSAGRHSATGVGGDVGFPVGGSGPEPLIVSDLSVTIKHRADMSPVWEGHAQGVVDARRPEGNTAALADKLAVAMFTAFPGESGRTIEVK